MEMAVFDWTELQDYFKRSFTILYVILIVRKRRAIFRLPLHTQNTGSCILSNFCRNLRLRHDQGSDKNIKPLGKLNSLSESSGGSIACAKKTK